MLIIQHNYGYRSKITVIVPKTMTIEVGVVILQELFIGNWKLVYNTFKYYFT